MTARRVPAPHRNSDPAHALVRFVQKSLAAKANPRKAVEMAAYMKTAMPFYGVQQPDREAIQCEIKDRFAIAGRQEYERAVLSLWRLERREEKYLAIAVAQIYPDLVRPESLPLYERMIREGAWWDFVDEIAGRIVGALVLEYPRRMWPIMDRWIDDDDLWIRRAAIICQLKHKERTDHLRLFRYCLARAAESDFFIRKGIGWALRQYSYTAPERVRDFLIENRAVLSPLSYREGAKVLLRKGLMRGLAPPTGARPQA
jgi:3-methyladenine DNA glycosylase AlkD